MIRKFSFEVIDICHFEHYSDKYFDITISFTNFEQLLNLLFIGFTKWELKLHPRNHLIKILI